MVADTFAERSLMSAHYKTFNDNVWGKHMRSRKQVLPAVAEFEEALAASAPAPNAAASARVPSAKVTSAALAVPPVAKAASRGQRMGALVEVLPEVGLQPA